MLDDLEFLLHKKIIDTISFRNVDFQVEKSDRFIDLLLPEFDWKVWDFVDLFSISERNAWDSNEFTISKIYPR